MESEISGLSYSLSISGMDKLSLGVLDQKNSTQSLTVDPNFVSNFLSFSDADCDCNKSSNESFTADDLVSNKFWNERFPNGAVANLTGYDENGVTFSNALTFDKPLKSFGNNILINFSSIDGESPQLTNNIDHAVLAFAPHPKQLPDLLTQSGNISTPPDYSFFNTSIPDLTLNFSPETLSKNNIKLIIPKSSSSGSSSINSENNSLNSRTLSISDLISKDSSGNIFNNSNPGASLTWIDSEGKSKSVALKINKPTFNPTTNEYWMSASPLNNNIILDKHSNIKDASLVIDATDPNSNVQSSLSPKLPPIATEILVGAGSFVTLAGLYFASRAMMQWCLTTWGTKENIINEILPIYEKIFPTRRGAMSFAEEFYIRLQTEIRYIDQIPADAKGFGDLNNLIDSDGFLQNCQVGVSDILSQFRTEFSEENFANLKDALVNGNLRKAVGAANDKMLELFTEDGPEGIIEFYTDRLGISAEELMRNPGLFTDFSRVARAVREDLNLARLNTQQSMRSAMQQAGFPCGSQLDSCWDEDISSDFTEGPAGDLAGQMIDAGVLDAEDVAATFLLEDIIGILIAA